MTHPAAVIAAPLAAAAVALGGCGGGSSPPPSTASRPGATTGGARSASPATRAATGRASVAWPQRKLVRRLRGRIIDVEGRRVAVDPTTITCQGVGRAQRRDHTLAWKGFHCVQPTFPDGVVAGPDAVFDVHPTGPRSLHVAAARFVRY